MNRIIPLWNETAPYTDQSPNQAQPSVKEFKVEGSHGAMIVCPGGGYTWKAEYEGDPICEMLNEAGISGYTLDYRVLPCNPKTPVTDALRAVRLLRSMGYEKVGIMGFSAGGHISAMAATLYDDGNPDADDPVERFSSRPDAFAPCYAPIDLLHYVQMGARIRLLGDLCDDEATLKVFSPSENITSDTPPCFIWHTANDELVNIGHTYALAKALTDHGVPVEVHIFPNGRHGLALAKNAPDVHQWCGLIQNWLKSLGF